MVPGRVGLPDLVRPGARTWTITAVTLTVVVGIVSMLPPRGTPGLEIADLGEVVATLGHVLAYALLGLAYAMTLRGRRSRHTRVVVIVVILAAYGAVLEALQGAVGTRSFQVSDVLANTVGAVIGVLIAAGLRRMHARS
jgi:VanZ family protein